MIKRTWNNLKSLIEKEKINLTEVHFEFAAYCLHNISTEIIREFFEILKLRTFTPLKNLIEEHIRNSRFDQASILIMKFNVVKEFSQNYLLDLVKNLVKIGKTQNLMWFLRKKPELR